MYLYANRRVASTRDYRISITVDGTDEVLNRRNRYLASNYIIKVFSFFLYVPYKQRYCKIRIWKLSFKKRRRYYYYYCRHRQPYIYINILCCTIATSDARSANDQVRQWRTHVCIEIENKRARERESRKRARKQARQRAI